MIKVCFFKSVYLNFIVGYDHSKYWRRRDIVINPTSKVPKFVRLIYLLYLRRIDSKNGAEIATGLGGGAKFKTAPILPHGLKGIVIHGSASIGKNVTIHQQVTIGTRHENKSATIGDDCIIGAGAKILGNIIIGDRCKIGANAVVIDNVPSNSTVVGVPGRIIRWRDNYEDSSSSCQYESK